MDIKKKLKEIEEHFKQISPEKFEENMKKAGEGKIEPASKSGYKMV